MNCLDVETSVKRRDIKAKGNFAERKSRSQYGKNNVADDFLGDTSSRSLKVLPSNGDDGGQVRSSCEMNKEG